MRSLVLFGCAAALAACAAEPAPESITVRIVFDDLETTVTCDSSCTYPSDHDTFTPSYTVNRECQSGSDCVARQTTCEQQGGSFSADCRRAPIVITAE